MTFSELRERQSWTLEQKIDHSLGTIEAFVNRMGGEDKVYVSFSGGKDSTCFSILPAGCIRTYSVCFAILATNIPI